MEAMEVSREVIKKKKKKCKAMSKSFGEKLSKISKNTSSENFHELSSFEPKKVKKKKRKNINSTYETDNKFSDSNLKLSKVPKHLTNSSSLLSKKKLIKTINHKESFIPENKALSKSKKKKVKNKRRKSLPSGIQDESTQFSHKNLKSERFKLMKIAKKSNSGKIHTKSKVTKTQKIGKSNMKCDNTSSLSDDMIVESEVSCNEYGQNNNEDDIDEDFNENTSVFSDDMSEDSDVYCEKFNQNNNEDDTDEDLEIRNELKTLNIFKEIKKLRKDNPMLFSNFSVASDCDSEEMEETGQSSVSNADTSDKLTKKSSKNLTNSSKEFSKSLPNTSKISDTHIKKCQADSVQTDQHENILQRDYHNKSEKTNRSSNLRNKAKEKLQAAKFRFLNEKLYTESGKESFTYFQKNNDEFLDYHTGYNLQVLKWPINPVNKIISSLQILGKKLVIADMGCGDAKIAQTLTHCVVHSFDLVALNKHVIPCNISKVPLSSDTVDVVVFCLSLMGTNLKEYLLEAFRILKYGGALKIAEVESRIFSLDKFIQSIESLGFVLEKKDIQHKLFVFLDFKKDKKRKKMLDVVLNPCLYKKR